MPKNKTVRSRSTDPLVVPSDWTSKIAPDIRRVGVGRWVGRWTAVIAIAWVHVGALTWLSTHTTSAVAFYAAAALPMVATAVLRPKASLYRWYRWVAVYALVLSSADGPTVLICAEAWALGTFFAPKELITDRLPVGTPITRRTPTKTGTKTGFDLGMPGMWKLSQNLAGKLVRGAR